MNNPLESSTLRSNSDILIENINDFRIQIEDKTFINNILDLSQDGASSYVCISNVHMTIEAYLDKKFCKIVNHANIATPDGMPLAKAMKMLYGVHQDRVAGMDLMPDLMKISEEKSLSIFLYGSTNEVLKAITAKAKREFPNLELYVYSPPFRTLSQEEKEDIVRFVMDIQKERNITVVLVEHDLGVVMDISDQIYVLDFGEVIGSGTPEEIARNPKVIEAYIGED